MSPTEAEYIAASEAAMKAIWIRKFISGLGIVPTINEPIIMFCNNSVAHQFANEPGVQRGARHYHRRYHYVRESIALGEIRFLKVHIDDNLADRFTKALSKGKLTQHARSMGLCLASSFIGIILLILGGFGWCYTHAYIEDGVTFIAKSNVTFLAKRCKIPTSTSSIPATPPSSLSAPHSSSLVPGALSPTQFKSHSVVPIARNF
ncbi:hypothetical protein Tco_1082874 [Tanacetum coccineum]|uniref:Retrotransposon protein, putative, Ty1-copia subclass n=1 Tax=Tanacetum coccineum TaxID=301880 RepID=A0ABQ5I1R2_9ASTR